MGSAYALAAVLTFAGVAGILSLLAARRHGDPAAIAAKNGLAFSPSDPYECTRIAFPLFRRGDGRSADNVMWRKPKTDGDAPTVRGFEYSYYEEHTDEAGRPHRTYRHHTCVLAFVNGSWPEISITRENVLDKTVGRVAGVDIDFESEEFNRLFAVRCVDRRFAQTLIGPELMEVLLSTDGRLSFEMKGRWLLIHCPRTKAAFVPAIMRVAETFIAKIPPVVWELYPTPYVDDEGKHLGPGDQDLAMHRMLGGRDPDRKPTEIVSTSPYAPIFDALDADGVDYDLDGKLLPKRSEDPWRDGA